MKSRRILFYSSVSSKRQFSTQGFYRTDIRLLRQMGFEVFLSKSWFDFLHFWRYDTCFIYFYRYGLLPAIIGRLLMKKVFFTGGIDYLDRSYAGLKSYLAQVIFFNLCGVFSTRNIIVSQADMDNCRKAGFLFNSRKNILVRHSIDLQRYLIDGYQRRPKLVTTIAWMSRPENVVRKGLLESLELFAALRKRDPGFRMKIIGSHGDGTALVTSKISALGLEGCVELTGALPESQKIDALKGSLFYFQLSRYEGFGIAAIEALAAGNLVVHSNVGGLREAVGANGLVFDGDLERCAEVLFTMASNGDALRNYAEQGSARVSRKFSNEMRLAGLAKLVLELA